MGKLFDLNIEQVLENWEIKHAIREIIANALDEQQLSKTKDISIFEDKNHNWHIRDYGRGLQYYHFTQNENQEKLSNPNLIGKFGVGLKDALGVLYRHNINVVIHSKYSTITLATSKKSGFNIETLHADFSEPKFPDIDGTEFILSGVSDEDIKAAKEMFLFFNEHNLLEKTKYGCVYENHDNCSYIYINGIRVSEEKNFMYTYNITNINAQIKKALNRERSNVGRTAYTDSIKKILTNCKNQAILTSLIEDLNKVMMGTNKDETLWTDVSVYAAKILNESDKVVFLTPFERNNLTNQQVEILQNSNKEIILITDALKEKLGGTVTVFNDIMDDYNENFEYKFVSYNQLTNKEKQIFNQKDIILSILSSYHINVSSEIMISETICIDEYGLETEGIYVPEKNQIIIKRKTLNNGNFYKVLLHEIAHEVSKASDNTRVFETVLTDMLGILMDYILSNHTKKHSFWSFWR